MESVEAKERYPIPNSFAWCPASSESLPSGGEFPTLRLSRTDGKDVTGKSELQRIYPSWIGWANMGALFVAFCGATTLAYSLVFSGDAIFLSGSVLLTFGLMVFLVVTARAARIRREVRG